MGLAHPVVIYPPAEDGGRRVRAGDHFLGMAYGLLDVAEFLRETGLVDADEAYVESSALIEWRGGGPNTWEQGPDGR
ncbi:hypothetical protein ACWD3J_25535 [Streptomyces sp. NPDC002755]|uniref:hypothetical protein n=1 Tax=Streptomyces sp. NPDC002884 TaxID=3154544 RepID=UPI003331EFDB